MERADQCTRSANRNRWWTVSHLPAIVVSQIAAAILLLAPSVASQPLQKHEGAVTAVEGESWLKHIHRAFDVSSMGRTWSLGPPAPLPYENYGKWEPSLSPGFPSKTVMLHGSDVYRLNCRGCHFDTGLGAPPEINSLIDPVRATSVAAVMQRMKDRGIDMTREDATVLAKQANASLMDRLRNGGQDMPSFLYVKQSEIQSLVVYLKQLAAVPGAEKEQAPVIEVTTLEIGEQIVKSTCHICHSATGPNPGPHELMEGAIPPLSTLTSRKDLQEFVRKVTLGAPIIMGNPPEPCRGRMSVFYYLSQDEAASAYLYLSVYPPSEVGY